MHLPDGDFEFVRKLVLDRSAISLGPDKCYLVEARLQPIVRSEGLPTLHDLILRLRTDGTEALRRKVVEAMAIAETSFFRDAHCFDAIRKWILPELLERRIRERTLRIWSGACASGQEPYSVAMLLYDEFPRLMSWTVELVATDISRELIARAREGRYSQLEVNRGLPASHLVKHFERVGTEWRVKEHIRRMVRFSETNLAESWRIPRPVDLILLRNVLIYFQDDTKKGILAKVRDFLSPEGYLCLGTAETTLNLDDGFERVQLGPGVCYRLRGSQGA